MDEYKQHDCTLGFTSLWQPYPLSGRVRCREHWSHRSCHAAYLMLWTWLAKFSVLLKLRFCLSVPKSLETIKKRKPLVPGFVPWSFFFLAFSSIHRGFGFLGDISDISQASPEVWSIQRVRGPSNTADTACSSSLVATGVCSSRSDVVIEKHEKQTSDEPATCTVLVIIWSFLLVMWRVPSAHNPSLVSLPPKVMVVLSFLMIFLLMWKSFVSMTHPIGFRHPGAWPLRAKTMSEIAMQWMRPRFLPEHLEHLNAGRLGRLGTIRLLHLLFVAILFGKYGERERERPPKIRRKIISQAVVFHFYVSGEVNHAKTACFGQDYDR